MKQKKLLHLAGGVLGMLLLHLVASAQVAQLRGRVLLKHPDGTIGAVVRANVDVFRMDILAQYRTETGPDGFFIFAGLPITGTYLIAASSPNAKPQAIANALAGRDIEYELTLEPGDGRRLTREEARASVTAPARTEALNAIVERSFVAANRAMISRNYDEAVKLYDEGLAAAAAWPEATVALLTNKSMALDSRGIDAYNAASQTNDAAQKLTQMDSAFHDFREAAESALRAVEIIDGEAIPKNEAERAAQQRNRFFAYRRRADAMGLFVSKVDPAQAAAGLAAYKEYIEIEDDPLKKLAAELAAARMLLAAKSAKSAIEQYRHILMSDPQNLDAILGYGLSLYQSGDRARFPEAEGYLQSFLQRAAGDDPLRQEATTALKSIQQSPK